MISEVAHLRSTQAGADALAEALPAAMDVVNGDPGCQGAVAYQGQDDPADFMVVITWDSVDAHQRFRDSPAIEEYRSLVGAHLEGRPSFQYMHLLSPQA